MPIDSGHGHKMKLHRTSGFGEVSNLGPEQQTLDDTSLQPLGTFVAINTLTLGVAANFEVTPAGSERAHRERCSERTEGGTAGKVRGGAHNRSDRVSFALTAGQITNLTAAVAHAQQIGLPLNRMVTVHWQAMGVPLEDMVKATGQFIDILTKALTRHGKRTASVWVLENGEGKGGHCHILIHVPASLVAYVARRQRSWLKRITGKSYKRRTIVSRPIGGLLGLEAGNPILHAANLEAAFSYVIKGADGEAAEQLGLTRIVPGGQVIGKRCGTSQNIGSKARSDHAAQAQAKTHAQ